MRVVVTFDAGQDGHRIGGGGFDPVVGATAAAEVVVARPGDVVPGDDADEVAVREIIAFLGIGGGMAELGFAGVALEQGADHQGNAVDFLTAIGALRVGVVINGFDVGECYCVPCEESFKHPQQLGSELARERTCELAATQCRVKIYLSVGEF